MVIGVLAVAAIVAFTEWEEWVNLALGVWVFLAPWVLSFTGVTYALWAHVAEARFAMCHEWEVGDLLMWNNLSVLHRRDEFDPNVRRVMHRTQIKGNERIA